MNPRWAISPTKELEFCVYDVRDSNWNKVKGLYIFAKVTNNRWSPLYIGKTEDFSQRMPNHERFDDAIRRGATHIHAVALPNWNSQSLDLAERYLITYYEPPLNTQHLR